MFVLPEQLPSTSILPLLLYVPISVCRLLLLHTSVSECLFRVFCSWPVCLIAGNDSRHLCQFWLCGWSCWELELMMSVASASTSGHPLRLFNWGRHVGSTRVPLLSTRPWRDSLDSNEGRCRPLFVSRLLGILSFVAWSPTSWKLSFYIVSIFSVVSVGRSSWSLLLYLGRSRDLSEQIYYSLYSFLSWGK